MFNIRRWMLRPRYELLEAGTNPLDDDALMQREKRQKRRSLWRWFLLGWFLLLGFSIWWMVARPGETETVAQGETPATLIPTMGGAVMDSPTTEPAAGTEVDTATHTPTPTTSPTPTPTPTKTPLLNDFWGGGNDTILTITPFGQKPDTTATPSPTGTPPAIGTATASATVAPVRFWETPTPIIIVQNRTTTVRVEVTRQVVVEVTRIVEVPYPQPVEVTRIVYVEVTATPGSETSVPGPQSYLYIPMVWR
jgi:hypothetical protein